MDLADIKKQARRDAAKRRAEAHEGLKDTAGEALALRGLPVALTPGIVSGFMPYKSEITTIPLAQPPAARGLGDGFAGGCGRGVALGVPRLGAGRKAGSRGVGHSHSPERAEEVSPDVLLVPGLFFDRSGYRLGYGGGFYDRTLVKLRALKKVVAIGVGYHAQLVDVVPRGGL